MNPITSRNSRSNIRPFAATFRTLSVGSLLTISLLGLAGCPSSSSDNQDESAETYDSPPAPAVKSVGLSSDEIDAANGLGMDTAEKIGRQVTAWFGKKEGVTKFTHAGSVVKIDDAHTLTLTDAEWKAFSDLFKLKHGRDFTVPTHGRSDKDTLGTLLPVAYKVHRDGDDAFQLTYVGIPGSMG
ncbi:MAG TPA: hypothetical protein VG711_06225 [Phycisphaerales bacterium]|nr:hypothetical protein [Phycisphaerales bacterium]